MTGILGVALAIAGVALLARFRRSGPYRAGPWPGLTPRGAGVVVGGALVLAAEDLLLGHPERALPDLPVLTVLVVVPAMLCAAVVRVPGTVSAVCGVYLLWASLRSLLDPAVEPPPLLLPAAIAFDLTAWLRGADLLAIAEIRPWRPGWRPRRRLGRSLTTVRASLAGAAFGLVLALVEPPFALLLGRDAVGWQTADVLLAACLAILGGACAGVCLRRLGGSHV
jgi:hypothetical protein